MKGNSVLMSAMMACCLLSAGASGEGESDCRITVFGSSTVWGAGLLDERSMVGVLDERLRTCFSKSVFPEEMSFSSPPEIVADRRFFRGRAARIAGLGSWIEFDLESDALALWQVCERSGGHGEIAVFADGERIGGFDNRNPSAGHETLRFQADGRQQMFPLGRPFTYGHRVSLDGRRLRFKLYDLEYVTGPVADRFPGFDGVVVRAKRGDQVEHFLYFLAPPKGQIEVEFEYGETVCYTACTVGGTEDEHRLESTFGVGDVPFDLANPTSFSTGLDFRFSNPKALWTHCFPDRRKRRFRLELVGGVRPYLMLNFASDRAHLIQNAGIGGFTAKRFLSDKFHRQLEDSLKIFVPDLAFIILGGNDDWVEQDRLVERKIPGLSEAEVLSLRSFLQYSGAAQQPDGTYTAVKKAALIDDLTPTSLTSSALVGSAVKPGNYVRIGNYYGDNNSTAVRVISAADPVRGEIRWEKPLAPEKMVDVTRLEDLRGAEFTVRTLTNYTANITEMIRRLRSANPHMRIVLLNTYTPNYFMRTVWGYGEALAAIAARFPDCVAADASPAVMAWIPSQLTGKTKCRLESTGAKSYPLPWTGHAQGFKVLVDGKDLYGKECRIVSGWYYPPWKDKDGSIRFKRGPLRKVPMELVFYGRIPPPGKTIEVVRADRSWSNDFAHPSPEGCKIIGNIAVDAVKALGGIDSIAQSRNE